MNMSLKKYVDDERICPHTASKKEIEHLFKIVDRDLSDASSPSISADRRHATAYNASLQLATIVLHASGYRAKSKIGHHWVTLILIPELMGKNKALQARYFNTCREKRNITDYDFAGHITEKEVSELIKEVKQFKTEVEEWLKKHHPSLFI
jgi:uncharacterized protein (UPF0332 family)